MVDDEVARCSPVLDLREIIDSEAANELPYRHLAQGRCPRARCDEGILMSTLFLLSEKA